MTYKIFLTIWIIFLIGIVNSEVANVIINQDQDSLNDLNCLNNQMAKWNGTGWQCQNDILGQNDTWQGNQTRIENNIIGNGTLDPKWEGNKTNWLDCPAGEYQYGAYSNGTAKCRVDINTWNSTGEIWAVVYNQTFVDWASVPTCSGTNKLTYNGSHILCIADIDTWNSTSDFWAIANNGTFTRYNGFYNSSLFNTTTLEDQSGKLSIKELWIVAKITDLWNSLWGTKTTDDLTQGSINKYDNQSFNESRTNILYLAIGNFHTTNSSYYLVSNPFAFWNDSDNRFNKTYADTLYVSISAQLGNTSAQIFAIANNGSLINFADLPLANRTKISYKNITDIPTCSAGANLFFNGSVLNCTTTSIDLSSYATHLNVIGNKTYDTWGGNQSSYYNTTRTDTNILGNRSTSINDTYGGNYSNVVNKTYLQGYGYYNATNYAGVSNDTILSLINYNGVFMNWTNYTTTGNVSNGTHSGYSTGNYLCSLEMPGTHMCTIDEILKTINQGISNQNFTATFRASEGAPGYLANANDCEGWTSLTGSDLGSIWVGSVTHQNKYGSGSLVACNAVRAIGCCK